MPARELLTLEEIRDLDQALIAAYRMHAELRLTYHMASHIRRPPIPAPLSESLVAAAAPSIFGTSAAAVYGGKRADLVVSHPGRDSVYVEVKATGSERFQEIKPRDLAADVLVWVAFGTRYQLGEGHVDAYVLPRPLRFQPEPDADGRPRRKLGLSAFLKQARALDGFSAWRFPDIDVTPGQLPLASLEI